jgi:hypothetical protein
MRTLLGAGRLQGLTVLLVDDEPALRQGVAAMLDLAVEAPPSRPSLFGGKDTGSAMIETVTGPREADGCASAGI